MVELREWRTVDKAEWPRGEWDNEPDKMQWADSATGLACLVKRNGHAGNLCGYVGVPHGHQWFGVNHDDLDVECHGGLTYSDLCEDVDDESIGICHVAPDEPKVWWIGFDCAHAYDRSPGMEAVLDRALFGGHSVYRTLDYVRRECAEIALQVQAHV